MSTPKARKAQKRALPKSLVIILKALEGQEVTLELRNEIDIRGTIDFVDDSMNTTMNNVSYKSHLTGSEEKFEQLYVSGKNIRYINIPDHINIIKTVEEYQRMLMMARNKYKRGIRKAPKQNPVHEKI